MNLSNLRSNLVLNISNFTNALNSARSQYQRFMSDFARRSASFSNSRMVQGYETLNDSLHKVGLGLRDIARISSGIMVSQLFYGIARSIREATTALWDFNESLDYANITYSSLFGSSNLAGDFLEVLKQFSVDTIFEYSDIEGMARKLSAYGIEYKNLMYIIEGLTNIGTISGDTAALERLAVAIGQINAKGTLKAEEMRQLANAYTPIYDVLREKLHLTEEDLGRVGDLGIKSADAINAIIDYANETFGATADAAVYTITGLKNRIVDTLKVMGVEMIAPISTAFKALLFYISDGLAGLRDAFTTGSWGGVLEYLVPNEKTQQAIRQFVANTANLFMSVASVLKVVGEVARQAFSVFVTAFNIIMPVITPVINTLAYFLHLAINTKEGMLVLRTALLMAGAAFVVLRTQALYSLVIGTVTKAVVGLSKALVVLSGIISRHPIFALISALGIGLVAVAANSEKAKKSIGGFMEKLTGSSGGVTSGDVFKRVEGEIRDNTTAAEQFNQRLEEGKGAADALKDSINGTGKAAKKASAGLLSFDEVFKLNESSDSDSGSGGALGAIDDLVGAVSGLGSSLVPTVPDFSQYAKDFSSGLFGSIKDALPKAASSILGGASLGSIIGGIIGGLITKSLGGVKIGALIGGGAGGLLGWLKEQLEIGIGGTGTGMGLGIATAIAKAFGGSIKDLGMLLKAGSLKGFFANLAGLFKGTGAKSLAKGGLLGAAVGFVVDLLAALFFDWLADKLSLGENAKETAKIGGSIVGLIGGIVGLIWGPVGSLIGGAVGTLLGGFVGLFWEQITEWWTGFKDLIVTWSTDTVKILSGWWSDTTAGFSGWWSGTKSGFSTWWSDTKLGFSTWWTNTKSGFSDWWSNTKSGLSQWWSDTVATFSDWDNITSETLGTWWSNTTSGFSTWWTDTTGKLSSWWSNTTSGFSTWWTDTTSKLSSWWSDTTTGFNEWKTNTLKPINDWINSTKEKVKLWAIQTLTDVALWCLDTKTKISDWVTNTKKEISDWVTNTWKKFTGWAADVGLVVGGFAIATGKTISKWASDTVADIAAWVTNITTKITKWFSDMGTKIINWFNTAKTNIKTKWEAMFDPNNWKSGWESIKSWFSDTGTKIISWFTTAKTNIKTKWEAMFDPANWKSGWESIKTWFSSLFTSIRNWFTSLGTSVGSWWDGLWSGKSANISVDSTNSTVKFGHAKGGIFNREHIARFAEGNKAEAVIPLEDQSAMQPFVNAIADGILQGLMPTMAVAGGGGNTLPPMYVGTLVADDRGLEQLFKKFEVYEAKELARKGLS